MTNGISRQGLAILAIIPLFLTFHRLVLRRSWRISKIAKIDERVLVLGASSGIGRSIALQYAERGARVCVVGRREAMVEEVVAECRTRGTLNSSYGSSRIIGISGDFADVDDMVRVRTILQNGELGFELS
jgi:NADPH:quinone reductase-like Zn-dependent oxidoreductase